MVVNYLIGLFAFSLGGLLVSFGWLGWSGLVLLGRVRGSCFVVTGLLGR